MKKQALVAAAISLAVVSMNGFAASCTSAATTKKLTDKISWDGSQASLGLSINTGNTDSSSANGEFDLVVAKHRFTNALSIKGQYGKSNGVLNKEQYSISEQPQYSFNDNPNRNNYFFINTLYQENKFAAYEKMVNGTIGYGRDWVKNDCIQFSTQLGPSYIYDQEPPPQKKSNSSLGVTATVTFVWNVTASAKLSEVVKDSFSKITNHLDSVTSFSNKLIGNLAVSLSFEVEHWSKIPADSPNTKKTNTTTTVNLVYTF